MRRLKQAKIVDFARVLFMDARKSDGTRDGTSFFGCLAVVKRFCRECVRSSARVHSCGLSSQSPRRLARLGDLQEVPVCKPSSGRREASSGYCDASSIELTASLRAPCESIVKLRSAASFDNNKKCFPPFKNVTPARHLHRCAYACVRRDARGACTWT